MRPIILSILITLSLLLTGCSNTPVDDVEVHSADVLWKSATNHLKRQRFIAGIKQLDTLESNYPYGDYADKTQLALMYAHYRNGDAISTYATAEHFIQMYPRHRHVEYAYYMKALAKFSEPTEGVMNYLPMNQAYRDIQPSREAFFQFAELIQRFPKSAYVNDSVRRMIFLKNTLAEHEINIAQTYMQEGASIAAIKRAQTVLALYNDTPHTEQALQILINAYAQLDMPDKVELIQSVYDHNFPSHAA